MENLPDEFRNKVRIAEPEVERSSAQMLTGRHTAYMSHALFKINDAEGRSMGYHDL